MARHNKPHKKSHLPSPEKAREILEHGEVHGKPLTKKQRGFMGMLAGGKKPTRTRKEKKHG